MGRWLMPKPYYDRVAEGDGLTVWVVILAVMACAVRAGWLLWHR